MPKYYEIQYREADDDHDQWIDWSGDSDPASLLELFVNAVSNEEIDDVNLYWGVKTTDA